MVLACFDEEVACIVIPALPLGVLGGPGGLGGLHEQRSGYVGVTLRGKAAALLASPASGNVLGRCPPGRATDSIKEQQG